jgi:spermidine synthase
VRFRIALFVAAASGFVALSYEILWYRLYSYVSWGSPTAFGSLLGFYLLGIAIGSYASRVYCKSHVTVAAAEDRRQLRVLAGFLFLANGVGFFVAPALGRVVTHYHWFFSLALVAIATSLLGAVLPLVSHFGISPDDKAGARLSYLYVANIIGSAAGSLLTGFVAMDHLSTTNIGLELALLGLALVAAVLVVSDLSRGQLGGALAAVAAVGVAMTVFSPRLFDQLYERLLFKTNFTPEARFAELVENRSGVINVTEDGRVWGGGAYDGAFNTDLVVDQNWIVRAYAVSAMHPSPRQMLMIGLASGSWAEVLANAPGLEKLTIVEINPGYLGIIPHHPEVASVLTNPKVEIVIDDGRRWLLRHPDRKFDAIVMNTSWNWRAHSTNLLSSDFLEIVRAHLGWGGFAFYNATSSPDVYKTAATVFPFALRVVNFVAVSDSPLSVDRAVFDRVLREYRIDGRPVLDLAREADKKALDGALALADSVRTPPTDFGLETRESLLARFGNATVITEDNMVTEWRDRFPAFPDVQP